MINLYWATFILLRNIPIDASKWRGKISYGKADFRYDKTNSLRQII
jgi:hypothetical protein